MEYAFLGKISLWVTKKIKISKDDQLRFLAALEKPIMTTTIKRPSRGEKK